MTVYLIRAQSGAFLARDLSWMHPAPGADLFATPHRDVAVNQLVELTLADPALRAQVVSCAGDGQGKPDLSSLAA
ncbi:MAG: hypothetical protein KatS3mg124_2094 [Porticoccaceae bacterium]|nr:MAG: hypothetical protein KatS3mg124_2094 [Porticoccaceae bacterium]